tara:strand:- start:108 stop:446 length:339 start_codon:yes stop_codon:yes gene_type:complete
MQDLQETLHRLIHHKDNRVDKEVTRLVQVIHLVHLVPQQQVQVVEVQLQLVVIGIQQDLQRVQEELVHQIQLQDQTFHMLVVEVEFIIHQELQDQEVQVVVEQELQDQEVVA